MFLIEYMYKLSNHIDTVKFLSTTTISMHNVITILDTLPTIPPQDKYVLNLK